METKKIEIIKAELANKYLELFMENILTRERELLYRTMKDVKGLNR